MRVIECEKGRSQSINFVDVKNRVVGFDDNQQCCESFDWIVTNAIPDRNNYKKLIELKENANFDFEDYVFDTGFFIEKSDDDEVVGDYTNFVVFKLIFPGKEDLFLILWNHHNGYYSHGFSFNSGEETLKKGEI